MSNETQIPKDPKKKARYISEVTKAYAEGALLEVKGRELNVWDTYENPKYVPSWDWSTYDYRVKPEPTYRPWKLNEVPVGAVVRRKKSPNTKEMILAASLDDDDGLPVKLSVYGWVNMEYLFQNYEQLGSAPCGIKEGAE